MASIRALHPHPALLLEADERYVIISDLHIGFEHEYNIKGIMLDSRYIDEMLNEIQTIIDKVKPDHLVLLGDIKNSIQSISKSEWRTIPDFIERVSEMVSVYIIPGNHDGNIQSLIPRNTNVKISSINGLVIDDTLLIHGHTSPSISVKRIVMGHLHPVLSRENNVLKGERLWLFLRSRTNAIDLIVLPAFNKYISNVRINKHAISPIIGKVLKDLEKGMILTLDGSIVGNEEMLYEILNL